MDPWSMFCPHPACMVFHTIVNSKIFKLSLNLSFTHLRAQKKFRIYKDLYGKTMQTWLDGKSCFSHTNASNFRRPLQALPRYTAENSQVRTKSFKSELLLCLRKVDHVIKSGKEPIVQYSNPCSQGLSTEWQPKAQAWLEACRCSVALCNKIVPLCNKRPPQFLDANRIRCSSRNSPRTGII